MVGGGKIRRVVLASFSFDMRIRAFKGRLLVQLIMLVNVVYWAQLESMSKKVDLAQPRALAEQKVDYCTSDHDASHF